MGKSKRRQQASGEGHVSPVISLEEELPLSVPPWLNSVTERLDTIYNELRDVKGSLEFALKTAEEAKKKADKVEKDVTQVQSDQVSLRVELQKVKQKLVNLEYHSRRSNLLFAGIDEESDEDCEKKLSELLKTKLKLSNIRFERVHRLGGPKSDGKPRLMIAKCSFYSDRMKILGCRNKLQGTNIWINEDFPVEVRRARSMLKPVFKAAKGDERFQQVQYVQDKLLIDGRLYSTSDLHKLPPDLAAKVTH